MSLDKEWEVARDVIAKADERVDGLRKYGFTFVTTLLTANALVLHTNAISDPDKKGVPWVAFGVSLIAIVLVVAMRLVEKSEQLLQTAASQRAQVIERHIGLELSDIIHERYKKEKWWWQGNAIYCVFTLVVAAIGVLTSDWVNSPTIDLRSELLAAFVFFSWVAIWLISAQDVSYRWHQPEDWSIDRVECPQGEAVRIMYTRWGKTTKGTPAWPFTKDEVVWRAVARAGVSPAPYKATSVDDCDTTCKVWLWDTKNCSPGLYDITIGPDGNWPRSDWQNFVDRFRRKAPQPEPKAFTLRRRVKITAAPSAHHVDHEVRRVLEVQVAGETESLAVALKEG